MLVLGIESSCDETAVALIEDAAGQTAPRVLSSVISTQIPLHRLYGGVIPELASRNHSSNLPGVLQEALQSANRSIHDVDVFASTAGPGLVAALLVGNTAAKALALTAGKPFIAVNHLEGHMLSPFILHEGGLVPHLSLVVSGGHTLLIDVQGTGQYTLLGRSLDDAAGEAFDKVAKMLDLPYPGGPEIDKRAEQGDATRFKLPRPMLHEEHLNFSFSGLKTAVLYLLPKLTPGGNPNDLDAQTLNDLCAGVRQAILDVLIRKAFKALKKTGHKVLAVSGGVSCNTALRRQLQEHCARARVELILPPNSLTTDNAAMIAFAGLLRARNGDFSPLNTPVDPNLKLGGIQARA
ncbi:MAG: tRNA (adenosine(37)-N6)-threonylcarbamoyltransferase complex transferase subunit TsaD [Akkermansiaceae bacterium]|nr:tRNA (adenosine(37)-N6)-threonylcarbamoyltransferase complex transferase subunit TsaD [Akkermansiaceae bacterium]